ncbi:MAG: HD domain-containing protein [Acholeplasmatales bacterium]|jgi:putative nucleotidyltransferase with HDIG domain|nr:HD domain-containing protein [Acholeplasmatales bacterium]
MELKLPATSVFRDPLYGYIHINYTFLKALIDTSVFQRLRRIKQLSGVYMVFHCAEHSRFTHCLGTYELALRLCESNSDIKNTFTLREQLLLLTSALLHDIGHGAYSHAFEDVFKTNHEHIGATIICENKEITSILDTIDLEFKLDVASIIRKEGKFLLIENLISSQLDVDRLDYLSRDAYQSGVPYGYVDAERILRVLKIKDNKIVFKESGIHAIENYLIARYHMYWQVYFHKTARSYEVILEKIYERINDLIKINFNFNCDVSYIKNISANKEDLTTYLKIDDNYINTVINFLEDSKDSLLSSLCKDFMTRTIWGNVKADSANKDFISKYKKEHSKYYYSTKNVKQNTYNQSGQYLGHDINILLENGDIVGLDSVSPVIKSLSKSGVKEDKRFFYKIFKI